MLLKLLFGWDTGIGGSFPRDRVVAASVDDRSGGAAMKGDEFIGVVGK
jgi:hypothetical protein